MNCHKYVLSCSKQEGIPKAALMAIEYIKWGADLNFEVDFGTNSTFCAVATSWYLNLFGK